MGAQPTGTVTFLFTDIEGSTKLWELYPQAMRRALSRHDAILNQAIEANGGHVFKTVGDAFCAAFPTAPQALDAALAIQRALLDEDWPSLFRTPHSTLRIRMALHTGTVEAQGGDYFGQPLNRVVRILSAGHGGQTLLSEVTFGLVRDNLPARTDVLDLGEHRLKDLTRPERIFQLLAEGLPSEFPPLRTLDNRPNNLPVQPTSFIGREKEVETTLNLLLRDDLRLLTLTGPGGTGKTRLALQVAAESLDEFSGGAWFANLAPIPITDTGLVISTIAQVLGVKEAGGRLLMDSLKDYLREKELLLLLDNFEQVVEARSQVTELMIAAPRLKVLVTSRLALQVRGEREWPVPPLALPPASSKFQVQSSKSDNLEPGTLHFVRGQALNLELLTQYELVRLFIERAASIKPDFEVTNDNAPAIAEICARLDGLPLAIELAAARIRLLTPQAMLLRLGSHVLSKAEGRLKLLSGGLKDLPARQQTLRSTIEWSHDLLSDDEKTLFRRLSVFQGGRTLEAIEAVCGDFGVEAEHNPKSKIQNPKWDVLEGVESLIAQNLLRQEAGFPQRSGREGAGGESRFTMLETIQEYAEEKLDESGEAEEIRRGHALYFTALAEEAEPHLTDARQQEWMDRLESERDNLWAALRWARERGEQRDIPAVDTGLRLGGALRRWSMVRGYFSHGREELDELILVATDIGCSGQGMAKALNAAGTLAWSQGDLPAAQADLERALALRGEVEDKHIIAITLNGLGTVAADRGDYDAARTYFQESLDLSRELGDKRGSAIAIHNLELLARWKGDFEAARALFEEKVALLREPGDKQSNAWVVGNLAGVAYSQEDYETARSLGVESLELHRELGEKRSVAMGLNFLGNIALTQGDYEAARTFSEEAAAIHKELGNKQGIANSYTRLGDVAWYEGDYEYANALYGAGLTLRRELGEKRSVAISLNNLALTALMQGEYARAWSLCEESLVMRQELGDKLGVTYALGGLGTIAVSMGEPQRGARLLGAAEALLKNLDGVIDVEPPIPYEQGIISADAQPDQEEFEKAWEEGRAMTIEQAIAYALDKT